MKESKVAHFTPNQPLTTSPSPCIATNHNFCLTLTHHRIGIKSQQFLVNFEEWKRTRGFLWPIDFTLHRVIYQMDLFFYESIDTSSIDKRTENGEMLKGRMRFGGRCEARILLSKIVSCLL